MLTRLIVGFLSGLLLCVWCSIAPAEDWARPNDPFYRRYPAEPHQQNFFLLEMEKAWKIEKGSKDVVVAVIDWAFDVSHPDLRNQLWTNPGEVVGNGKDDDANGFIDDVHGWDFLGGDATLEGQNSQHGNHVSGIIAAETNNGVGVAGMAPGCRLMLVKMGEPGVLRDGAIMARAIRYCVDNGAKLICKNHGLSEYYPGWHVPVAGELKEACDYAYTRGVLIVSGTSSNDGRFYPAGFQGSFDSVMGTGASDIFGRPSNIYGGSLACEVIAPGGQRNGGSHNHESIYSCYLPTGQEYHAWSGGCMANPHVAGLLALVLSHYGGIDVEQARQIVRNTAKGEKPGFEPRWGHGLIQPVAALSLKPDQIATRLELQNSTPLETNSEQGERVYALRVRNAGVLDARVMLRLLHNGQEVAGCQATVPGFEATEVHVPTAALPPATQLTVRMEDLGMARPRVYDDVLEIKLHIADEDVTIRRGEGGQPVLVARVHNEGSVNASRVVVILHHHEPAVPDRTGPPSRMMDARVISVPASGTAEAEFSLEKSAGLDDLWVEIEQLDVGVPHVPRQRGKARLLALAAAEFAAVASSPGPVAARPIAQFKLDEGQGDRVTDSLENKLVGTIRGARWSTDGELVGLAFDGKSSGVEIPDHPSLSGMKALRVDAKVKFDEPLRTIEPLAYKWRSGRESASFGLAVLNGHPYVLIRTDQTGYTELRCTDLVVTPGKWHTVSFLYTGTMLTAAVDGRRSDHANVAYGAIDRCPQPLRLGAATDKDGKLVSFMKGKMAELSIGVPEVKPPKFTIPGRLEMDKVVRVLFPEEAETFFFEVAEPGTCRIRMTLLEGSDDAEVELSLRLQASNGDPARAALSRREPAWETRLDKGRYVLKFEAPERVAYRLNIEGVANVWQNSFRATDRGAGAKADYIAWLSTRTPGKGVFEVFDCSEGSRFLFLAPRGSVQAVIQTGGVMGDSSARQGGLGVWRRHSFFAGAMPCGAWFYCPSDINASGDYAIRGNFTIHWRRPTEEEVMGKFTGSPTMLARKLKIRGGETTPDNRRRRYLETIEAGLKFMATLTEKRDDGHWMYERWMIDRQEPRIYWGDDGQMLCARSFYHAFQRTNDPEHEQVALGIARRVVGYQQLDPKHFRYGALPYGLIGNERKTTWGSSNNIQGKILYGLAQLASWSDNEKLLAALKLNADYYVRMQYDDGRWAHYIERMPQSVCGYPTAWGVAGLLVAYEELGDEKYLASAERALAAYLKGRTPEEGLKPDGSIICHCTHGNPLEDNHAIRSSITMLTPYALAHRIAKKPEYRKVLDNLHRYLAPRQHASGVIKQAENDCVNLIYCQNWGLQGFCEAFEATGDRKFLEVALRLADFFVRVQLVDDDPHMGGAWVGSYNVAKDSPTGNIDDEGNLYDLYTSWGAGPIVYGLQRLLPHVDAAGK